MSDSSKGVHVIEAEVSLPAWIRVMISSGDDQWREYGFEDSCFQQGKERWKATTLYKAAEDQGCEIEQFIRENKPAPIIEAECSESPSDCRANARATV